jgi:hypothetical protein
VPFDGSFTATSFDTLDHAAGQSLKANLIKGKSAYSPQEPTSFRQTRHSKLKVGYGAERRPALPLEFNRPYLFGFDMLEIDQPKPFLNFGFGAPKLQRMRRRLSIGLTVM